MHVCLFDIDGTLLNTGGAGSAAMKAALKSEFGAAGPIDGIAFAGRTDRAIAADLLEFYGVEFDEPTRDRFIAAYLSHLPAQLASREGLILPGIARLLEMLDERNDVLLGLLTGNYRRGAQVKLGHYEIDHYFEFGGFGDRHLDRNDVAHEALAEADQRLDGVVALEKVWVIGDTPADVRCARAIGANVVAVGTGTYSADELASEQPDYLFEDLSDPDPLVSLLR